VKGAPSFLLVDSDETGENSIKTPPFLKIEKEVTGQDFYSTGNIAKPEF